MSGEEAVTFGAIDGIAVGTHFERRADVSAAGVHRALIAGIVGRPEAGAESIVASGGYEDDEDLGDVIIYTGQGGRNSETGRQVADQTSRAVTPRWLPAASAGFRFASCEAQRTRVTPTLAFSESTNTGWSRVALDFRSVVFAWLRKTLRMQIR